MIVTDDGIQIDSSDEHQEKADSPRLDRIEPASNLKLERFLQKEKEESETAVTDEGMQIEFKHEQEEKQERPIVPSCDPCSKVTRETVLQS
jgi:hypothetical protein